MGNFLLLVFSLAMPYSYDLFDRSFYSAFFEIGETLDWDIAWLLEARYFTLDSLFCIAVLIIYVPWYFWVRAQDGHLARAQGHTENRKKLTLPLLIQATVITLGLSGLSYMWLNFVDQYLYAENILGFGSSMDSFVDTWTISEPEPYIWTLLSVVLLGPIVEELIFRGIQYRYLRRIRDGWFVIVLTAISFGVWHLEPVQMVYTAIIGLGMGIAYYATENLNVPIFIHILNNFLSTLPPGWDTDASYELIDRISLWAVLPMLVLLACMMYQKGKENRLAAEVRQAMIYAASQEETVPINFIPQVVEARTSSRTDEEADAENERSP